MESAWLIEHATPPLKPYYLSLTDDIQWTEDHNLALRMARQEDAEALIDYLFPDAAPRHFAIEHQWISHSPPWKAKRRPLTED